MRRVRAFWFAIGVLLLGALGAAAWVLLPIPSLDLEGRTLAPSTLVLDRHGRVLYEVLDPDAGSHRPLPLEEVPLYLRQAVIATEDASFYANPGVDVSGIARAALLFLRSGEVQGGGSTITQQVARNLLMGAEERYERTLRRKAREALLALYLTATRSKDEILALYLNELYYGHLAYGVEAASQAYFGKPVAELGLAECALIAGLPQAPGYYDPTVNLGAARARQRVVLERMVDEGYITAERAAQAAAEPLRLAASAFPIEAPHLTMYAIEQAEALVGTDALRRGGLVIHTTLDLDQQRAAEAHVARHLADLAQARPDEPAHNVNNAAVVALDPTDGAVRVMVGSPDYFDARISGAVNAALALRQPGSSIKPLTFAAAFERGYSPASVIADVPTTFTTHEGRTYTPVNYDYAFHGLVSLRTALGSSYNVAAVRLLDEIGVGALEEMSRRLGVGTLARAGRGGLALTLGAGEVRLLDLTAAYGALATGGLHVQPYVISRIETADGRTLYTHADPSPRRVLDERVAYLVTDILADPAARRPAFGEHSALQTPFGAAVKTGTTTEWRDNWTVGYTRDWVVGVWVGNADNEPMRRVSGVTGAAPIWRAVLTSLHRTPPPPFEAPEGLVEVEVCAESGLMPGTACVHRRTEPFLSEFAPTATCNLHRLVTLDAATGTLAGPATPPERRVVRRVTYWPADVLAWAAEQGLPLPPEAAPAVAVAPGAPSDPVSPTAPITGGATRVSAPADGARYCLAADLPPASQALRVEARAGDAGGRLALYVDGTLYHRWEGAPYTTFWPLSAGEHVLYVESEDAAGHTARSAPVHVRVLPHCREE